MIFTKFKYILRKIINIYKYNAKYNQNIQKQINNNLFFLFQIYSKELLDQLSTEFDQECLQAEKYSNQILQQQQDEDNKRLQEVIVQNIEQIQQEYYYDIQQLNEQQPEEQEVPFHIADIKTVSLIKSIHEQYIVKIWSLVVQILENIFDQQTQNEIQQTLQYDQFTQNQSILSSITSNVLQVYQDNKEMYIEEEKRLQQLKQDLQEQQQQIDSLQKQKEIQKIEFNKALSEISNKTQQLYNSSQDIQIKQPKPQVIESKIKTSILNKQKIVNTNLLSLRTTVQTINEIYQQKIKVDNQQLSQNKQIQNIRQFVFKFFNQKYGSLQSTQENKQSALQRFVYSASYYSKENFDCLVFIHELNNEIGENFKEKMLQILNKVNFSDKRKWYINIKQTEIYQNNEKLQKVVNDRDIVQAEKILKQQLLSTELKNCFAYQTTFKLYDIKHLGKISTFGFDKLLLTLGVNEETMRLRLTNRAARGQSDVDFTQGWIIVEKLQLHTSVLDTQISQQMIKQQEQYQQGQETQKQNQQEKQSRIPRFDNQQLKVDDLQ